jgi:demethylmenaquinone methyltransferase / 2-methoxy-6-polyprenyl-1,4-benzoquinol methylase
MTTPGKASAVRDMFGSIAPRYDFLNHLLSANIDRRWRRVCADAVRDRLSGVTPRILDAGCGTGDLALEFSRLGPVVGCDFSQPMLQIGVRKAAIAAAAHPVTLLAADALALPFRNGAFDAVACAFVLRNLSDLRAGLREIRRVLRPGGTVAALEFAFPRAPVLGTLYRFYFARVLPVLGRMISGVAGAYRYLPDSVEAFPPPEVLTGVIAEAGFSDVQCTRLSAGIAVLYLAR